MPGTRVAWGGVISGVREGLLGGIVGFLLGFWGGRFIEFCCDRPAALVGWGRVPGVFVIQKG